MTVRLYKSTDASAPVLTGQVGSLIALLDAILVNGYGAQAAAGWSKAFSGTNTASYRMATTGNTGFYLDVNDAASGTGGAKEARMRGYEAMTAVATGTNPFPTVAQSSFGVICRKSNTADATARAWYCIADGSVFYLFVDTGDYVSPAYSFAFSFGDFFSYKASDPYRCQISGRRAENSSNDSDDIFGTIFATAACTYTLVLGTYIARHWSGIGGSVIANKHSSALAHANSSSAAVSYSVLGGVSAAVSYPNGPDGSLILAPVWLGHSNGVRGYLKGIWAPCHNQPCGHGDTFNGSGNMAGKAFIALNIKAPNTNVGSSSTNGQVVVETSDTWS